MKTKVKMTEGPDALDRFQRTMKTLFQVPKSKVKEHEKPRGKKQSENINSDGRKRRK